MCAWGDLTEEQKDRHKQLKRERYAKMSPEEKAIFKSKKAFSAKKNYNSDKKKDEMYQYKYGITKACRDVMAEAQDYKCAICGKDEKDAHNQILYVDHDHDTGNVRALLCNRCNKFLGFVEKDIKVLELMKQYIKKHKEE